MSKMHLFQVSLVAYWFNVLFHYLCVLYGYVRKSILDPEFLILGRLGLPMDVFVQWPALVGYFHSIPPLSWDGPCLRCFRKTHRIRDVTLILGIHRLMVETNIKKETE